MNASAPPRKEPRHAYVEDCEETEAVSTGSDSDAVEESRPPANVGTKRSNDPSIVKKSNKYATSDSGYSSLTTTTASSSNSKNNKGSGPSTLKRVVNAIRSQRDGGSTTPAPSESRRMSRRRESLSLRTVESREEAAKMRLSGNPVSKGPERHQGMPGGYPTSPTGLVFANSTAGMSIPNPRPRTRADSVTYQSGGRPLSFTGSGSLPSGSLPSGMYIIHHPQAQQHMYQQVPSAQVVHVDQYSSMMQQQQQQAQQQQLQYSSTPTSGYQMPMDPYLSGQMAYVQTPASSTPGGHPGYAYTTTSSQTYYPSQSQTPSWALESSYAYPPPRPQPQPHSQAMPPPPPPPTTRRLSMGIPADYQPYNQVHYPPPPPPQYSAASMEFQRRLSQTVAHTASPYALPPPQTPTDEGVFIEDEDYYRMPPPPRPASSHPQRPLPHSRTTSSIPQTTSHRLSRGSIEYYEPSTRKQSFEGQRPPSRPGLTQRYSSASTNSSRMYQSQTEPVSPVKRRTALSMYSQADIEEQMQLRDAEAYQARNGAYNSQVTANDIPLTRRATRTSDAGSRGSGSRDGGEAKHSRRVSRQSLDKQRARELYEREYGQGGNSGMDISVNTGGASLTIKHSRDGDGGMSLSFANPNGAATTNSRPPSRSTRPAREPSRVRSGGSKKYIEGSGTSGRSRDKVEYEAPIAPRPRRSSSVQPAIGIDDLSKSMRKLKTDDAHLRDSRSSSRSGGAKLRR